MYLVSLLFFFFWVATSNTDIHPFQPLRTAIIFSLILKLIQISLLFITFQRSCPRKKFYYFWYFCSVSGNLFHPCIASKRSKFVVLSSFIHVVTPAFDVLSLSSELVSLSLYLFLVAHFLFSHEIVTFTEKYPQERWINCSTIILEESNLPWYAFSLGNNSLLAKRYETLAAYQTRDWL
jgi:hypothetical protein